MLSTYTLSLLSPLSPTPPRVLVLGARVQGVGERGKEVMGPTRRRPAGGGAWNSRTRKESLFPVSKLKEKPNGH
jgi:hypothetical protein